MDSREFQYYVLIFQSTPNLCIAQGLTTNLGLGTRSPMAGGQDGAPADDFLAWATCREVGQLDIRLLVTSRG